MSPVNCAGRRALQQPGERIIVADGDCSARERRVSDHLARARRLAYWGGGVGSATNSPPRSAGAGAATATGIDDAAGAAAARKGLSAALGGADGVSPSVMVWRGVGAGVSSASEAVGTVAAASGRERLRSFARDVTHRDRRAR
jgi:hypothetical protein